MGESTDTIIKEKAKGFDAMMAVIKTVLPMLLVGGIGGGVAAGGIAVATPAIPVPNGVAKEAALNDLRNELKSAIQVLQQQAAVDRAESNANMRAIMSRLDRIEARQDREVK